jgi:glycosyltransferase involved in cell wall biosynthesis
MTIALDISPLTSGHFLQHRVRGTGFYLTNLRDSLEKYFPKNTYYYIKRGEAIPTEANLLHIPYFEPFFITLPLRRKIPTVVTVHDLTPLVFPDKFPRGLKGSVKWHTQKMTLKNSDLIITDSFSSKKDIHKYSGISNERIQVVYLAAAEHFKKLKIKDEILKVRKKYNLSEKFLLYVGDATWNKNLPGLIKAVNKTNYCFVIVGSAFVNKDYDRSNPWNRDLYEAQVLAESNKNIRSLGFVADDDLVKLYNMATCMIMPSFYEGFGLPVLEAMNSGCPVITSKEGSLSEVADQAAYFVDPYSVDSITKGIKEVMENENLRHALSEKGLMQARRFSWKKTAEETTKVYERTLNLE